MENNISKFYCWIKRENISFENIEILLEENTRLPTKKKNVE